MTTRQKQTDRLSSESTALHEAATAALRAPSIFNTQPWKWHVSGDTAELRVDRSRQLAVVDPDGRFATISCGIALHHFVTALAAAGVRVEITRLPDPGDNDLLAVARVIGHASPNPVDVRHYQTTLVRHTERQPFGSTPVPTSTVDALRAAVTAHGAHLHVIRPDQVTSLIVTTHRAAEIETSDPAYRAELASWTRRPSSSDDGMTPGAGARARRGVPIRDFALSGTSVPPEGPDDDSGATYAIVYTPADGGGSWLRAGEAVGAALVAAVEHGASVSPMSDLLEVPATRIALRQMLAGLGEPMLALRIGISEGTSAAPATVRRAPEDVIERDTHQAGDTA